MDVPASRRGWRVDAPTAAMFSGVLVLGAAVRLVGLARESLWLDEALSIREARESALFSSVRPLYHVFLRALLHVTESEVMLRLPSAVFSILALALLMVLARQLAGREASLVAGLLMALAVPEVVHAQEVRMYAMASGLSLGSLVALASWSGRWKDWRLVLHGTLAILALLTTPICALGLAPGIGVILLARHQREGLRHLILLYVTCAAVWAPWAAKTLTSLEKLGGPGGWLAPPPPAMIVALPGLMLTQHVGVPGATLVGRLTIGIFALILTALLVTAVIVKGRNRRLDAAVVGGFALVSAGLWFASWFVTPVFHPRYLLAAAPLLYLGLAIGLLRVNDVSRVASRLSATTILVVVGLSLVHYHRVSQNPDVRSAAAWVRQRLQPQDTLVVVGWGGALWQHYLGRRLQGHLVTRQYIEGPMLRGDEVLREIDGAVPVDGRLWLLVIERPRLSISRVFGEIEPVLRERSQEIETYVGFRVGVLGLRDGVRESTADSRG